MAAHFDEILGTPESSFYLANAPRVHMLVGDDYARYVDHFRARTTTSYQENDETFMREVAEALKTLPRIFLDLVLPQLPTLHQRLRDGARMLSTLAVVAGGPWRKSSSGFPGPPASVSTSSRIPSSWRGD